MIKPIPIVATLSMSRAMIALTNSRVRPPQISKIISIPGNLSVSPIPTAKNVGIVAQCKTMFANQPKVSVETECAFSLIRVNSLFAICLISSIFWIPIKNVSSNFTNLFLAPLWVYVISMII